MATVLEGPDRYIVVCNFTAPTATATVGTKAHVVLTTGGEPDRLTLRYRSRGGRQITKWEHVRHLGNFRKQTIPAPHPMYEDAYLDGQRVAESVAFWAARSATYGKDTADADRA